MFTSDLCKPIDGFHDEGGRWNRDDRNRLREQTETAPRVHEEDMMIEGKTVLVTGANRGIGRALLEDALRRGAKQVYAGTRQSFTHADGRVTPLVLDMTDAVQIQAAAASVESLDVLINNAGIAPYDDSSDRAVIEQRLAANLFGTYPVTQAFLPLLFRSRGAILNNV